MKCKKNIFAFFLLLVPLTTYSHSDTTLQLENGKLIGLPGAYQPARFDFEKLQLTISGKVVTFPHCIKPFFNFDRRELLITSSWYHGGRADSLPPYITFGHENNYPGNIMLSLDSLRPIPVEWGYGASEEQRRCLDKFTVADH